MMISLTRAKSGANRIYRSLERSARKAWHYGAEILYLRPNCCALQHHPNLRLWCCEPGRLWPFLLVGGVLVSGCSPAHAHADSPAVVTHDGTPEIVAAIRAWGAYAAIVDGGVSAHPDIWLSPVPLAANAVADGGGTAFGHAELTPQGCKVETLAGWPRHNRNLFLHEVGHCLGLSHNYADPLAIMSPYSDDTHDFRPDDVAAIQAIYGPRTQPLAFRAVVGVGRD